MDITKIKGLTDLCSGCFACYSRCRFDAISMQLDGEGFYFPAVDKEKCSGCGECVKVCQIENTVKESATEAECYSAWAKDEKLRMGSSSGGIFGLLAELTEKNNGEVYGAVFDKESREVRHGRLGDYSIEELRRSKYVQSNLGNVFREIETYLKMGKEVLFCGTPCQVKGLRYFLKKDYDNLLLVDFICHGTPSPGLFKDMLLKYENKQHSRILNVTFREKDFGWEKLIMKLYFKNGQIIREPLARHYYYYYFISNISLKKSCFSCDYKNSLADIRLSDFWGRDRKIDDDKGISFVELHTEKGKRAWNEISETKIHYRRERSEANGINYQARINGAYCVEKRNQFFDYYRANGWEKTVAKYRKVRLKEELKLFFRRCKQKLRLSIQSFRG